MRVEEQFGTARDRWRTRNLPTIPYSPWCLDEIGRMWDSMLDLDRYMLARIENAS